MMAEAHVSRVSNGRYNLERWNDAMETRYLKFENFQKGDQWMALTRMHAEIVVNDEHVWSQFEMYCRTQVRTVLYSAGGFVPSSTHKIVPKNRERSYLGVPSCRCETSLLASNATQSPGEIVISDNPKRVPRKHTFFHLRVPSC